MFQTQPNVSGPPAAGGAPQMATKAPPSAPAPAAPGGAPGGAGAANPQGGGLPPQIQRFVNPNDPVQAAELQGFSALSAQDAQTLVDGMSPPAMGILKRALPKIAFIFDLLAQKKAASAQPAQPQPGATANPAIAANGAGPAPAAPQQPPGVPRPATRLSAMS